MTRWFGQNVGVVTGMLVMMLAGALPAAAGAADKEPVVKATRTAGQAVISLRSGSLLVTEALTADAFDIQVSTTTDVVRFTGNRAGQVTVRRGAGRHAFAMRQVGPADRGALAILLDGSEALAGFDAIMRSAWARTSRQAAPFVSAHSMIGVLRGDHRAVAAISAFTATPAAIVRTAASSGPGDCWREYTHDVVEHTYELEACMDEASESLNPLRTSWCAYEYNIKTTLAGFWLLDCYGVI